MCVEDWGLTVWKKSVVGCDYLGKQECAQYTKARYIRKITGYEHHLKILSALSKYLDRTVVIGGSNSYILEHLVTLIFFYEFLWLIFWGKIVHIKGRWNSCAVFTYYSICSHCMLTNYMYLFLSTLGEQS